MIAQGTEDTVREGILSAMGCGALGHHGVRSLGVSEHIRLKETVERANEECRDEQSSTRENGMGSAPSTPWASGRTSYTRYNRIRS